MTTTFTFWASSVSSSRTSAVVRLEFNSCGIRIIRSPIDCEDEGTIGFARLLGLAPKCVTITLSSSRC